MPRALGRLGGPAGWRMGERAVLLSQWFGLRGLSFGLASGFGLPRLTVCGLGRCALPVVWVARLALWSGLWLWLALAGCLRPG